MSTVSSFARGINPLVDRYHHFDKLSLRTPTYVTCGDLRFLRKHAHSVFPYRGRYIRGFCDRGVTVVCAKAPALQLIAELPNARINHIEVAVDLICDAHTKYMLRDLFDEHFVQPWHGGHVQSRFESGTLSRRRGACQYEWYCDRHSKVTGEVDCFHLEGRHFGVEAVRRVGIEHPRDLLTFDHDKYWRKNLKLFEADPERLGRFYLNQLRRERRRHPLLHHTRNGFVYNVDRATGNTLLHVLSMHLRQANPSQCQRSIQCFVDQFGEGSFPTLSLY